MKRLFSVFTKEKKKKPTFKELLKFKFDEKEENLIKTIQPSGFLLANNISSTSKTK